jgi:hypothetical protein
MHEEILYPVCPHRNVPAAFERFLGPDSGGIERFFPDVRAERVDGTLLSVRQQRERASRILWDGIALAKALVSVAAAACRSRVLWDTALAPAGPSPSRAPSRTTSAFAGAARGAA